jgi:hypothetical protein
MFASSELSLRARRMVCLAMAMFVVVAGLSLGALGAQAVLDPGYTVEISEVINS